jgi:flagellar secretion chaperone FliS
MWSGLFIMQAPRLANHYLKEQLETASPEQILLMLYDGAIKFLRIAKNAMAAKDLEKCHNHLIKTQNILTELMTSLNFELGGEVARNLYKLYDYYIWSLVQANIHKDPKPVDEVLEHLKGLKQTWEQAILQNAAQNAVPSSTSLNAGQSTHLAMEPHTIDIVERSTATRLATVD